MSRLFVNLLDRFANWLTARESTVGLDEIAAGRPKTRSRANDPDRRPDVERVTGKDGKGYPTRDRSQPTETPA